MQEIEVPVRKFLWCILLDSPSPSVAFTTAHLLAAIVSTQIRHLLATEPGRWRQLLNTEVHLCLEQLRQRAFVEAAASGACIHECLVRRILCCGTTRQMKR
jgi:hypothetical protein